MLLIEKPRTPTPAWPARFVSRASFIACQGEQVEPTGQALAAAFAAGGWETVKSFHQSPPPPGTTWFNAGDWSLSTAEPSPTETS